MNRADFFKKLGLGALGIAIAPKVLGEIKEDDTTLKPVEYKPKTISSHIKVSDEAIDSLNGWHKRSFNLIQRRGDDFPYYYTPKMAEVDFMLSKYINDELWLL